MNLLVTTTILLILILSTITQYVYAACTSQYSNGIVMTSVPNIMNYNKYETNNYLDFGGITVVDNANLQFSTVDMC